MAIDEFIGTIDFRATVVCSTFSNLNERPVKQAVQRVIQLVKCNITVQTEPIIKISEVRFIRPFIRQLLIVLIDLFNASVVKINFLSYLRCRLF